VLSAAQLVRFVNDGYLVVPGAVPDHLLCAADAEIDLLVGREPPPENKVGPHFYFLAPAQLPAADAMMTLDSSTCGTNAAGQTLQQALGSQGGSIGIAFGGNYINKSGIQLTTIGCPSNFNNGNLQYTCTMPLADRESYGPIPPAFKEQSDGSFYGFGCDAGHGMSGAPVMYTDPTFGANTEGSDFSYLDPSYPATHRYGPYLGCGPR
jgi:hypothetical protein